MKPRHYLFFLLIAFCKASLAAPSSPASKTQIDTMTIMQSSLSMNCIDFQVAGVCFWLRCTVTPPSCSIEESIRYKHYNPDAIVQIYTTSEKVPWDEMSFASNLFGTNEGGGFQIADTHSSTTETSSKILSKEVDVIGSPGMLAVGTVLGGGDIGNQMTAAVNGLGNMASDYGENLENSFTSNLGGLGDTLTTVQNEGGDGSFLQIFGSNLSSLVSSFGQLQDVTQDIEDFSDAMDQFDSSGMNDTVGQMQEGVAAIASMGGVSSNFYCARGVTPFFPYYTSGADHFQWRYPYADFLNSATWLHRKREVGERNNGQYPDYLPLTNDSFGNVFPRMGAIRSNDPYKAGTVFAQRAADIVTESNNTHIRLYLGDKSGSAGYWPPGRVKEWTRSSAKWQMLAPYNEGSCHIFGEPSTKNGNSLDGYDHRRSEDGNYVWQLWRPYSCCERKGQVLLYTLP